MALQTFLWLVLGGVFASTVVIVVVFVMINMCIRRKAAKYDATSKNPTKSSYELSNSYKQNGQEDIRPPLPPRDQFDTESLTNSYEDVPEIPVVEAETSLLQNPDHSRPPDTHVKFLDNTSDSESYDDVDALQNVTNSYEDVPEIPVVEVETSLLQNPDHSRPPDTHVKFLDNTSDSESYDDVDALQNVTNSYEDVPEIPVVEAETSLLQNPDHSRPPDTHVKFLDNTSDSESYDDVDALQNVTNSYEDVPEIPVVEVETSLLQNPDHSRPPDTHVKFLDNTSDSESYDDVDALQNVTNSYEDVPEIPVVEAETSLLQNPDHSRPPDTHVKFLDNTSDSESYDDVDALQNVQGSYEEVALLPDHLEVDLPPFQSESDNGSENYDDVDQLHGDNEDYDDVG